MTESSDRNLEERVLLLAASSKDVAMTRELLGRVGIACFACSTIAELTGELARGAALVLLTEHAMWFDDVGHLAEWLQRQPPWSDLPVIVLARGGGNSSAGRRAIEWFGNATVLERPAVMASLLSVVRTLLRSRERQYQIRQHLLEREKAGMALRQSEERLRLILQNITDYAIFAADPDGIITEWMEGAERVGGWTPGEIIGRHLSILYTPEDVASGVPEREIGQILQEGRAEREGWQVRKGGERFWGNEIATVMRDPGGQVVGLVKIIRDLSENKRIADELRDTEQRYRVMVANVREYAIFMTDPQGRIMTWNAGAERTFGYSEAEILGQEAAILFTPEDQASGAPQRELATAAGEGRASDDRWQMRRGGERFFASGVTTAMRDAGGTLRGFVKVCRDLTERRQIEVQRERLLEQEQVARLEAERAMTLRDEFLAVVSHELRTPLTAILLWAKMLSSGAVEAHEQTEVFETIRRSAEAQQQLIEDLLDISRMMSGKLRLNMREADLAPVLRAAVEAVRPMAEAKGIFLALSLDERVGPVRMDPDRIQQVVWNLLNNAVKFTDRGGRVRARLERRDHNIVIEVQDTGQGISPEFLPHVFERFRQADATSTRTQGGLGLGLGISRQLVELHGGTIRAESAGLGHGTTFVVELPLVEMSPELEQAGPADMKEELGGTFVPSPMLKGMRVLVVEDEANTRRAIQWLLEQCAAEVTAVASAAQAIATFREALADRPFHVVLSDVGMPIQNGYELMRELRDLERRRGITEATPAVALTAYARVEDKALAMAAGFQTHVPKPVEPATLVNAVRGVVQREQRSAEQ
jgi:PAS domain S-box-containing protein